MLAVLLAIYASGCWDLADRFVEPRHTPAGYPVTVLSPSPGRGRVVTLEASPDAVRPGVYFLVWPGGSATVGPVIRVVGGRTERLAITGPSPPVGAATLSPSFDGDPGTALAVPFSELRVPTELGPAPAWYIPGASGPDDTWVIMVHGLNATRLEPLRAASAVHGLGLPILDITYRNDIGAPRSPDGLAHLGATEWRDLDSAVGLARGRGARHVVLYGWSMGAQVIARFLALSASAHLVSGVVLDSPVLSIPATVGYQAAEGGIAAAVVWGALQMIRRRTGARLDDPDALAGAGPGGPPTLIIEGSADTLVPPPVAAHLAVSAPGSERRYVVFPSAGHTMAWNVDPARYRAVVTGFLRDHEG
jgi:hypothetical protein